MSTLSDDEFIQLCEDELQVLNEIFPEDITDLRHSKYDKNGRYIPPRLRAGLLRSRKFQNGRKWFKNYDFDG